MALKIHILVYTYNTVKPFNRFKSKLIVCKIYFVHNDFLPRTAYIYIHLFVYKFYSHQHLPLYICNILYIHTHICIFKQGILDNSSYTIFSLRLKYYSLYDEQIIVQNIQSVLSNFLEISHVKMSRTFGHTVFVLKESLNVLYITFLIDLPALHVI